MSILLTKKACTSKLPAALAVICLCGSYSAYAAQSSRPMEASVQAPVAVSGVVVDAQGQPVVGASVVEKGTMNGVITDFNGKFSISVKEGASLEISCIGYKTVTVAAASKLNVVLEEDSEMLSEAVVVGFGSQKKENLTGAVGSVNVAKALEARPIADVGQGLQGSVPGLNVRLGSTEVGSDAIIRIRGQVGSYQGSASPLILLDNVEIPSLTLLNPEDIESISVLKDAASASIYGAKAAFGVILITSKKSAEKDNVHVSYSGSVSFQNNVFGAEAVAGVDALHYQVEAMERLGTYTPTGAFWYVDRASWQAAIAWKEKYGNLDPSEPMTYGRDWYAQGNYKMGVRTYNPYDYMVRKNAPTTSHNVSVAGNKGRTNYNISASYLHQTGMMKVAKDDSFVRYNASARVSTQITDWLNVHTGLMFTRTKKSWAYATTSTTADQWYYLYRWGPTYPLVPVDEYGNNVRTQAYEIATANTATITTTYTSVNVGTTITPLKNWNINFDYTYAVNNSQEWDPGIRYYAGNTWTTPNTVTNDDGSVKWVANEWNAYNKLGDQIQAKVLNQESYTSSYDLVYQDSYTSTRGTYNATSTYDLNIADKHQFKFMVGLNAVDYKYTGVWGQIKGTGSGILDLSNPQFALTTGTQTSGGSNSWSSTLGFFGRINYNYKEKYLLEANIRYDGSSKFPTALKWRWFPSFSAGWRVTEEPWMAGAKDVLSSMKIRASWGTIGDQSVSSSLYIPTISSSTSYWIHSGAKDQTFGTPGLVDSNITWQDIETLDFGIDFALFNQVNVTFDWYRRTTKNMLVGMAGLSYNIGASAPNGNYGQLHTDGWELSINWGHVFDNGIGLNLTAGLADAVSTIDQYGSATSISGWYNGKTYGEIWGYQVDRLFQNEDFAWENGNLVKSSDKYGVVYKYADGKNYATQGKFTSGSAISMPGDIKYVDQNGDGVIDPGLSLIDDHGDMVVIGNTTPRYEYSFRIDADWKGIDLSVFIQGIGKRDMWGSSHLSLPGFDCTGGCMAESFAGDFWYETKDDNGNVTDSNYDAYYPRAYNLGTSSSGAVFQVNDRYLLNMAYLRIKNITLGYTIPAKITKKIGMNKCRFYVSLENFFTFDHLNGLPIDVEEVAGYSVLNSSNYNSSRAGVGAPGYKTAAIGVQVTF